MNFQEIIVIVVVTAAFIYMMKRIRKNIKHDGSHDGCAKCDAVKNKKAS